MKTLNSIKRLVALAAVLALPWAGVPTAYAHHANPSGNRSAAAGLPDGTAVSLEGRLSVLDFVYPGGASHERIYAIVGSDGAVTRVAFAANATPRQGASLVVSGYASRGVLIVQQQQPSARKTPAAAAVKVSLEGTLKLLHADYFAGGTSRFIWELEQDGGATSEIDIPIAPTDMHPGMRIVVNGMRSGTMIAPDSITALTQAPAGYAGPVAAAQNSTALVILLAFQPTPPNQGIYTPFWGQAWIQGIMFTGSSSVAAYWSDSSFGQQTLTGSVTPWLTASFPTPATCDYTGIATEAKRVAQLAGYVVANYQKFVYVFTNVPACGWAGLGEVPGTQAWSNESNTVSVIGHEVGHTFGLGHANSLPCNGATIATNCPLARPEYGDPWDIMGNVSSRSINAWQKNDMGWVPDAKVSKHPGGTASYTLSPLTSPGGTLYAVQVPAAVHRTYWVEFRQATGFDAGLPASATNGAIIHLGGLMHQPDRSEYGCWDTCFLDMVPTTATMGDGALAVPNAFVDSQTGVTITAVSKDASGLTVSVASPQTHGDPGIYRKLNASSAPVYKFFLDYGSGPAVDAKIPFGMAGDIPLTGNFTNDGLTSIGIYRNGTWYFDTNRNGTVDKTFMLGGVPGDVPLAANFTGAGATDDLVIYRAGTWYVDQFHNGTVDKTFHLGGVAGDIPLAGDVNGDGIADLVIYRHGVWYIDTNRDGTVDTIVNFGGMPQDIPVLFDWDGDGKADLCVFRDGTWFVNTKRDGTVQMIFGFGVAGDTPLPGHFY